MGQKLLNKKTGQRDLIDDDKISAALASGNYEAPSAIASHRPGLGDTYASPEQLAQEQGLSETIDPAKLALQEGHKIREKAHSGIVSAVKANIGGAASGLTMGAVSPFEEDQEFNKGAATVGEIGGALLPAFFGDEAGLANLLATDSLEAERAASTLSSKFLYSGEIGAEGGTAARSVERGLARAGGALDEAKNVASMPADLHSLDSAGLGAAEKAELASIEQGRVPMRAKLVEDLGLHRNALKNDEKLFLASAKIKEADLAKVGATLGPGELPIQEVAKLSAKAGDAIQAMVNNPKALARSPGRILDSLTAQENAMEQLAKREAPLRQLFAADTSGDRAAALDALPKALERNRALQEQAKALIADPSSARLSAIGAAKDALKTGSKKGLLEGVLGGSIMGHVAGMFTGMPIIGPLIGAKAGQLATDLVFGRLGKAAAVAGERGTAAVTEFLNLASKAKPTLGVLATRTLAKVAYAPRSKPVEDTSLPGLYRARTKEIKSQTMYAPDGSVQVRPDARALMASKLAPIRAVAPLAADRLETLAARRLAFLSSKIPRRPDIDGIPMGPDRWQPSELEMREFARYAAAVEDPHAVIERLANGTITPEDAEAMRAVYPDMMADIQARITQGLPTLRKTLPYNRRVALSIFSGVPVDPAMKPEILAVLQGSFESEEGSQGGTQMPQANPQFGSVQKSVPKPTPAQERAG